jgi:hypothetical protein
MKKTFITLCSIILLSQAACKREEQTNPIASNETAITDTALNTESLAIEGLDPQSATAPMYVPIVIAGKANAPGHADGAGSKARFYSPSGIFVKKDGSLLIADGGYIQRIVPGAIVSTITESSGSYAPEGIAATTDGAIATSNADFISVYRSENDIKTYYDCFHCQIKGIDVDPGGKFFWYVTANVTPSYIISFYAKLDPKQEFTSNGGYVSGSAYAKDISVTQNGNKFFATDEGVIEVTKGQAIYKILPNAKFDNLTSIAISKDGTKIYLADNGSLKLITRCPTCQPTLKNLVSNVDASAIALSNSGRVLFFTSEKRSTVSKINLQ